MSIPKDVYPESGFRLPLPKREDMDNYGKGVYDRILDAGERTWGMLHGPWGVLLHSPRLADLEDALNHYVRFESGIGGSLRELAILVTAREMNSQFQWSVHEPIARKEGLAPEIIDIVKYSKRHDELNETENVIIQLGREIFRLKKVTAENFARARKIFGDKQLVDLIGLMADYAAIAILLCAFEVQLGERRKLLLPLL